MFRAIDSLSGDLVFIKSGTVEDIAREAELLISSPANVAPRVTDLIWSRGGTFSFVTAAVPGTSLEVRTSSAPADVELLTAALEALHALHESGILHLDLNPANVVCDADRRRPAVRFLDFGSAVSLSDRGRRLADHVAAHPEFAAPELVAGRSVDRRADLYSLGRSLALRVRDPEIVAVLEWMARDRRSERPGSAEVVAAELGIQLQAQQRLFGPLVGRSEDLERSLAILRPGANIVRSWPGTGISRFLAELALRHRPEDRDSCVLDLSGARLDASTVLKWLDDLGTRQDVLVGLPEPSSSVGEARWSALPLPLIEDIERRAESDILLFPLSDLDLRTLHGRAGLDCPLKRRRRAGLLSCPPPLRFDLELKLVAPLAAFTAMGPRVPRETAEDLDVAVFDGRAVAELSERGLVINDPESGWVRVPLAAQTMVTPYQRQLTDEVREWLGSFWKPGLPEEIAALWKLSFLTKNMKLDRTDAAVRSMRADQRWGDLRLSSQVLERVGAPLGRLSSFAQVALAQADYLAGADDAMSRIVPLAQLEGREGLEARRVLMMQALARGDRQTLRDQIEKASDGDSRGIENLGKGALALLEGDPARAADELSPIVDQELVRFDASMLLSASLFPTDSAKSIGVLEALRRDYVGPDRALVNYNLAIHMSRLDRPADSLRFAREAVLDLGTDPSSRHNYRVRYMLAEASLETEGVLGSTELVDELVSLNFTRTDPGRRLAVLVLQAKTAVYRGDRDFCAEKLREAWTLLDHVAVTRPKQDVWRILVDFTGEFGEWGGEVGEREAIELDAPLLEEMARLCSGHGWTGPEQTCREFRKLGETAAGDSESSEDKGRWWLQLGRLERMCRRFEQAGEAFRRAEVAFRVAGFRFLEARSRFERISVEGSDAGTQELDSLIDDAREGGFSRLMAQSLALRVQRKGMKNV